MRIFKNTQKNKGQRSIFHSLFIPLIIVMVFQTGIFYFSTVYGGLESSLKQNAADIMNERLLNRKTEIESLFTNNWSDFSRTSEYLNELYGSYKNNYGNFPFLDNKKSQISFLSESSDELIRVLRHNKVNGIFLILNDQKSESDALNRNSVKYGLGVRDMDQNSNYTNREDLLIERSPSSIINKVGCSLDSWWEATYSFTDNDYCDFYFMPLKEAYSSPNTSGENLAFFAGTHRLSSTEHEVVSFSIPLISDDGYPYGVLGVELTTKYLNSLLPSGELSSPDKSCYILGLQDVNSTDYYPITGNGSLYNRCFDKSSSISTADKNDTNGFDVLARGNSELYGSETTLDIYNNNNPFEDTQLVLAGFVEKDSLFAYISNIERLLQIVGLFTLTLGVICILIVSRRFAAPITSLAKRVEKMTPQSEFELDRLGIVEIDQLVDSIETLNKNVSKDIARTEFFSRMSHDMRTPMNAIISFSSPELLDGADESVKNEYLDKIHSSGQYLLGLINEVLDMTKIESKKIDIIYSPVNVSAAWNTVISMIDKLAQKKNINFVKTINIPKDLYLMIDEQHLDQVVMNLLSNAVKFTPENGTVSLTISVKKESKSKSDYICQIKVTDSGIGMGEEFLKKLYTPFEQENVTKEGTGLGLSIAKTLVEQMNGSINCQSKKGLGTTFELTIPMESSDFDVSSSGTVLQDESLSEINYSVLEGKNILVCEDHPLNTQIICRLLERKGISVTVAENGQIGVDKYMMSATDEYDAILMDIRMPVMTGLEASKVIRSLDREDAKLIPIIAMTANAFDEDVRASKGAGMNAHLSKPVEPDKLYKTLVNFLGR